MATRLILTLFALMGLLAQAAPAHACAVSAGQTEVNAVSADAAVAHVAAVSPAPRPAVPHRIARHEPPATDAPAPAAVPVLPGIDRARE